MASAKCLPAGQDAYQRAALILQKGGLVALPTETVYGLAGNALNDAAIARIYTVKGRPRHNPLIAHIFNPKQASRYATVNPLAQQLIDAFWPGPLTLVLPRKASQLSKNAGAGLNTIALRCPDAPWREVFIHAGFDGPIFMPSANLSGRVSPTTADHVTADLGDSVDLIIDGGACPGGIESTVLKIDGDTATLLRPGTIPVEAFAPFIANLNLPEKQARPVAPGMLESHYAPRAKVRLNADSRSDGEAYLAFGPTPFKPEANLSATGDLTEAAQNLFAYLRLLDRPGVTTIAVAPIPFGGLGDAINDRLQRASSKR